jgi:hypothetical protein
MGQSLMGQSPFCPWLRILGEAADHRIKLRPRSLLKRLARGADEEKACDAFSALAQRASDCSIVTGPTCNPAGDKAMGMDGVEQVHADCADAHLLFPFRNFGAFLRGVEQYDQRRCHQGRRNSGFNLRWPGFGVGNEESALHKRGKCLPVTDFDKTPGKQLSMIGCAHGQLKDCIQRRLIRPRRSHVARLSRAAGGEIGGGRGEIVKHIPSRSSKSDGSRNKILFPRNFFARFARICSGESIRKFIWEVGIA